MMHADYLEDEWIEDWLQYGEYPLVTRSFRGLSILRDVFAHPENKARQFDVQPQYRAGISDGFNVGLSNWYWRYCSAYLDNMVCVFTDLTKLHLVIHAETPQYGKKSAEQGHLRRVLQAAGRVEELSLELWDIPMMDCLHPLTKYDHLRKLSLVRSPVEPMQLLSFLETNQHSLKLLHLWGCDSDTVDWMSVFHAMRAQNVYIPNIYVGRLGNPAHCPPDIWATQAAMDGFCYVRADHRSLLRMDRMGHQ